MLKCASFTISKQQAFTSRYAAGRRVTDIRLFAERNHMTMEATNLDQSLRDSITGLVSALGGMNYAEPDHPYVLGDDALGCLKDLKKWVRLYGLSRKLDALRCIADTNLVSL